MLAGNTHRNYTQNNKFSLENSKENSGRANFRSEYRNKLSVNANFRNELSVKVNFRLKFRHKLSVKANFRSKIRVYYNNRHCENSANFLRTFALDKNSPFFVKKPRNSPILSNYVLITFSQYCIDNLPGKK